ncbi:hypothetical protein F2P81_007588 [Scophthalmus maximus]|uniref:Cadherin N-terminal domain-containing protein n=1 Tax=Scophthalmus maximus TaxID=52904 RepID=A0A6A4SZT6_SCOMX|nr:hypothetical protein F2P81_007588 [Scophthalmus maximus]
MQFFLYFVECFPRRREYISYCAGDKNRGKWTMVTAFGFSRLPQNMKQRGRDSWRPLLAGLVVLLFARAASAQQRYSISEEVKEGAFVGNIAKDLGIDLSIMKQRGFRIMSGSSEPLFKVNENDGVLYTNRKIDREEVCKESTACLINLKTVLENPLESHYRPIPFPLKP